MIESKNLKMLEIFISARENQLVRNGYCVVSSGILDQKYKSSDEVVYVGYVLYADLVLLQG